MPLLLRNAGYMTKSYGITTHCSPNYLYRYANNLSHSHSHIIKIFSDVYIASKCNLIDTSSHMYMYYQIPK